jgi:gliding motility-associated-like protein
MKWTSTTSKHFKKLSFVLISLIVLTLANFKSYAQQAKQRVYATSDDRGYGGLCLVCGVDDRGRAYDTDLNSASNISVGLGVVGSAWQELRFPAGNLPGSATGSVIKISSGTNLVGVNLGAFKFQAYNGNDPVGSVITGSSSLLNLLSSGNQSEIFIPAPGEAYDRVRITVDGGLLSIAANLYVYHAYFLKDATSMVCDAAVDELHGISGSVGALGGVTNAQDAIDNSETSYSILTSAVGLLGHAQQTVIFNGSSMPGDSVRMIISTGAALVELDVLKSIAIETFNGNTSNGVVAGSGGLLTLRLLSGAGNRAVVTFAPSAVFDRVQLRVGGVASVLQSVRLHDVKRLIPTTVAINGTVAHSATLCVGQPAVLTISSSQTGATYRWYTQATGGTAVVTGTSYTPTLASGINRFYVEATRTDCTNSSPRKEIVIIVNDPVVPVLTALSPICAGTTATLTVASPQANHTYRWYDVSTNGTPVFTGASYTTPALTGNKTYYVESVLGGCQSVRVPVNVVVNPAPALPEVTTNAVSINSGETATLTATAAAGNTIRWYSASTGGALLETGPSYTTPALTADRTVYVEAVSASGCSSARVAVLVTVINGSTNPNCNAAVRQRTGIDGLLCLLCGVDGPGNSTDANLTNFTKINLAVGVAATGYQRLIFNNSGVATDSVRVDLEIPVGLADLSVLSGITVRVMNGNNVVSTYALNSSLVNLRLLGGNRFKATVLANGAFDRVEVRFGGLVSALSSLNIYGAEIIYPNPTIASEGLAICSGNSTTINATANGGTTLRWFADATGGTALVSGNSYTTPVLTANRTYYIEVSKAGCANPERMPVTVVVTSIPPTPVVAAVTPICSGSSAVIPVTGAVAGTTYTWYTTLAGTTPVFTGPSFTTPALTGNTTYYVQAANGPCVAPTRTAVLVTVNPRPVLPQVQASATTINAGQTSTLTATSPDSNIEFNWYTSLTSTTRVATGSVYVTPPLSATTTYYLEAKSTVTGCTAVSRVQVTINVSGPGTPNPVPCEAPTLQNNDVVNGIALLSGVFNASLAIDNDTKTASSLVLGVAALNASVYQRVGFTTLSNIGDTVRVLLSAPGKLLSVGLLSSIRVSTYNGNTPNNDGLSLNDPLIRLELLSGNSEALVSFVPTKQFNYIEVRLNSGVVGALSTVDLNYAQRVVVAPEVASPNVTACANTTTTLTVQNPKAGITYKWYNAAGTYQAGKDGTSFVTPVLTANTRFFVEANTASGCASYRTPVNVTVTLPPTVPVLVSPTINTCTGSDVVISVSNPITGIIYKWYNAADQYQAGKDGPTFTVTGVTGTTSYKVEAVNSCGVTSAKATATINVGTLDAPVVTPNAVTVNSGSPAVLTATSSSAGAVFTWYDSPTATTSIFTGSQFVSSPLINTGTSPITVTFYVAASIAGGCPPSARTPVVVTILPAGTNTDVPCEAATKEVRRGVDGVALITGVFNPGLAYDNSATTASSLVLPVAVLGASVYQHVGFNNLSVVGDTVRVRVSSPGKLLSLAVLPSLELTTYKGTVSNNDMIMASNPLIKLELLSDNSGAIFSFVPQQQFDGVELRLRSGLVTVLGSIDFNYAQRVIVAPKVQSANATACVGTSATLTVTNPVAGTVYKWYRGAAYQSGKDGVTFTTDATLPAGTYDYFVSANRNGCESAKTKVVVTVLAAPLPPVISAGNPTTGCPNTAVTLSVNAVAGVTFNWYDALTGGNLLATNTNTYITPANLAPGVYNFYVEAVNANSCVSPAPRTRITFTVNPTSVATDITVTGNNASFCAGTRATLTATSTIANPIFTWYNDANLTSVAFTGAVFQTPVLTVSRTYYVTVSGTNRCENTIADAKAVVITVTPPAVLADITVTGLQASYCSGTAATLTASSTTVTNPVFTWYSDPALTTAVFTGPVFNIPSLTSTVTYYVTVRGTNKCENTSATARPITITVNPTPEPPVVANAGTSICSGDRATLSIQNAQAGLIYTWYDVATGGTALTTGAQFTTPVLTANADYYVVASSPAGCGNTTARVKVTVTVSPRPLTPTVAAASVNACLGTTPTLSVTSPQTGVNYKWYTGSTGGTSIFTGQQFTVPAVTGTVTYYVEASTASCTNATRTPVTVTASVTPTAPTSISGAANSLCSGSAATLVVNNPVAGVTYKWYTAQTGGNSVFEGNSFMTTALTTTTTYYVEGVNATGCASSTRTAVTVTILPVLAAPAVTVQSATSTSVTFTWNAVAGASSYEIALNGGSTWIQLAPGVTSYLVAGLNPGQTVTISVRAVGQLACQLSPATTITDDTENPLSNQIFVPNTFTPNGDGQNDILYVYGNSIAKLRLRVYNQWGQFIYESLNIQNGWDGTYKGQMQPNGVYVYQLEAEFNDGTKTTKKGTITLLR